MWSSIIITLVNLQNIFNIIFTRTCFCFRHSLCVVLPRLKGISLEQVGALENEIDLESNDADVSSDGKIEAEDSSSNEHSEEVNVEFVS